MKLRSKILSKNFKAIPILDNDKALIISQLTTLIKKSSFVIYK